MRAVDTNVLVRLITGDDADQTAIADAFVEKGAWASTVAVVEAIWVLSSTFGFGSKQILASIELLLSNESMILQDREVILTALDTYRGKPALKFSDCVILELARRSGHLPLGTFDRALATLDGTQRL